MTVAAIESVDAVRACVLDAAKSRTPLRVSGRGTWLDAGRPVRATETISTRELSGITAYVPGDLTLTARAGTTLAEIKEAAGAHNQWLALNPYGSDEGSIGATVATASAGPLSTNFGTPRDLVLGLEFVTGSGTIARGGGRVVKNVAGFDLTRLFTGSWGTLGVITEVTVRLHTRPESRVSLAIPLASGSAEDCSRVRAVLRRLLFTPFACEVMNAALASRVLGTAEPTVLIELGGNGDAVQAQRTEVAELAGVGGAGETDSARVREVDSQAWTALRTIEPPPHETIVFRLSRLPSEIGTAWAEASAVAAGCKGTLLHASPARGVVRCIVPRNDDTVAWLERALEAPTTCKRIGERMPDALWPLCAPSPIADSLSSRIKASFDPNGLLNPGIFGELS